MGHSQFSVICITHMTFTVGVGLGHQAILCLSSFSTLKVLFCTSPHSIEKEGITYRSHLRSRELFSISKKGQCDWCTWIICNYFTQERFLLSYSSINYLLITLWSHRYFILWIMIQNCFLYIVALIALPLDTWRSFPGVYVPVICSCNYDLSFFPVFSCSDHDKYSRPFL